jgi:hypothetical protein
VDERKEKIMIEYISQWKALEYQVGFSEIKYPACKKIKK